MAAEVLGRRVIHDVDAEVQWPHEGWTHHGIVHDDGRLLGGDVLAHSRDAGLDVYDFEEGVGGRLEEDHGEARGALLLVVAHGLCDGLLEDGGLGGIDVDGVDAAVGGEEAEQPVGAAVDVVTCDDALAGAHGAGDDVEAGHARGDGKGVLAPLDVVEVRLEDGARGVAGARVVKLLRGLGL